LAHDCAHCALHQITGRAISFLRPLLTACLLVATLTSAVQARGFIRDAEIEATLLKIVRPILQAAGMSAGGVRIVIVNDPSLNAFVAGRNTIFLNSGLLARLETVGMIQAVIAHEVAHIQAGHMITRQINAKGSQSAAAVGVLLAGIAASQGADGSSAAALAVAGVEVAKRQFLSHTRAEEAAADQASIRYLARAGIPPQAALDALNLVKGQEALSPRRRDPYALTHPLSSQRISYLRDAVASTRVSDIATDPSIPYWHARMVAKFEGFQQNPRTLLRRIAKNDTSELATYRRAIAAHRMSNIKDAHRYIDALINARPNDPYYRELKAQFLLEAGDAKAAINHYRAALERSPKDTQIATGLARALLATDTPNANREALKLLENAKARDVVSPQTLQYLALAYARSGDRGRASLATAERYALAGRLKDADIHARRAESLLAEGTPAWRNANDIRRLAARAAKQE